MRALILLTAFISAPALADLAIGDEALWLQLLPVATRAAASLVAIRASCAPPMCNPGMLNAVIEQQHAAALGRCQVLYVGNPSETALCVKFDNVVFQ